MTCQMFSKACSYEQKRILSKVGDEMEFSSFQNDLNVNDLPAPEQTVPTPVCTWNDGYFAVFAPLAIIQNHRDGLVRVF